MEALELLDTLKVELRLPIDNVFILDVSELNGTDGLAAVSGEDDGSYQWVNLFCDTTELSITRGMNLNQNVFSRAEATQLEVVVRNVSIDPYTNPRVGPNTLIRVTVYDGSTWRTLFTGQVKDFNTSYTKSRNPSVSITAYDLIYNLNNIQTISDDAESLTGRLYSLGVAGGTSVALTGGTVDLAPKMTPGTVWDLMNLAMNTEAGFIFANRVGGLEARGRGATPDANYIEFSDIHGAFNDHFSDEFQLANPKHSCYTDIDVTFGISNTINTVNIKNVNSVDDSGADVETDIGVFTDSVSVATWGESSLDILLNFDDDADISDWTSYVFDQYATPQKKVNSITFKPQFYWQTIIDVGDYVGVQFHDSQGAALVDDSFMVSSVKHSVTPFGGWEITLELFKGGE